MKNKNLLISIVFLSNLFFQTVYAQGFGEWTWMAGNNTTGSTGVYGTKGVASALNTPPATYEGYEWTDQNGNFWMFGGVSLGGNMKNALWKYDPAINQWTWVHGSSAPNASGVYGTQGVPAPNNVPGARAYGGVSWTDNVGDLWLFSGYGYDGSGGSGVINDLWRYNIASNQWTWMKGSNTTGSPTVFGTKGVPAMANTPDGRQETNGGVADGLGNLWLFGGLNFSNQAYNDVWRYNIATNMWTWISGNQSFSNIPVYGTINVSAPTNDPGDRFCYTKFIDSQNNLYFLGAGLVQFGGSNVVDVWKFNTTSFEWTWVGGTNTLNDPGSYINKCDTNTINIPEAKFEIRASWSDSCGFFFFGGFNFGTSSYADLWYYNIETNKFNWISGTNAANSAGVYGTKGVSAATNLPKSRGGANAFKDTQSNLWLFGGLTFASSADMLNDMWRFKLDPNCGKLCSKSVFNTQLTANFSANTICGNAPLTVQFTNNCVSATSYTWNFGDGSPLNFSSNPAHTYTANGTYSVSITAQGTGTNTATAIKNNYIYIGALPNAAFTTLLNDTVCLNTPFSFTNNSQDSIVSNNWSFGDGQIATTSNTSHNYLLPGSFTVSLVVTDNHNCKDTITQNVVVLPSPIAQFNSTPNIGCANLAVQFNNTSSNATSYSWQFGDSQSAITTSPTHTYTSSGTFTANLIAQNALGCTDTASAFIVVNAKPDANFTVTGYDGCFPYAVNAFANTNGLNSYQWTVNNNSLFSTNDSIQLGNITENTAFQIKLITTNTFGCKDSISVSKQFSDGNCGSLLIPNVFTPNGDISNSLFAVKALNYKSYYIIIYDRWGLKMFESSDLNVHWNGKRNNSGNDCPEGTYFYILNVTDKNDKTDNFKGFLTLFR